MKHRFNYIHRFRKGIIHGYFKVVLLWITFLWGGAGDWGTLGKPAWAVLFCVRNPSAKHAYIRMQTFHIIVLSVIVRLYDNSFPHSFFSICG